MKDFITQMVDAYDDVCKQMNTAINTDGKLKRSGLIKTWHSKTNYEWELILGCAKVLHERGGVRLTGQTERDIDTLLDHIQKYGDLHHNILDPDPKANAILPNQATHIHRDTSVKTVLWRVMMNVREAYCRILDIDLPNADSSMGRLPNTQEQGLFQW